MNVNVDAKNIVEIIKSLPYKAIMFLISVISALLIFLPDVALKKMFLLDFRDKIGTFLGVLFIFSTCITAYLFISPKVRDRRIKKALSGKKAVEKLNKLSPTEKQLICYMYHNQDTSVFLSSSNPTISHLKQELIITETSSLGTLLGLERIYPFSLHPWVVSLIRKKPDLLQGIPVEIPDPFAHYQDFYSFPIM